jgi:hypothetical protein
VRLPIHLSEILGRMCEVDMEIVCNAPHSFADDMAVSYIVSELSRLARHTAGFQSREYQALYAKRACDSPRPSALRSDLQGFVSTLNTVEVAYRGDATVCTSQSHRNSKRTTSQIAARDSMITFLELAYMRLVPSPLFPLGQYDKRCRASRPVICRMSVEVAIDEHLTGILQ